MAQSIARVKSATAVSDAYTPAPPALSPPPLAVRNAAPTTALGSALTTLTTLATVASQAATSSSSTAPPSSASTIANEDPGDASVVGPLSPAQVAGIVIGISVFMVAGFVVVFVQMMRRTRHMPEEEQRPASQRRRVPEARFGTVDRSILSG
jgi:hypothetical protein